MQKILIWDLPTRFLHWAFAVSLTLSLGLALAADDDSRLFQLHMLSGLVAAFVLGLRVLWGLTGSRYARFTRFPLRPAAIARYLAGIATGKARRYVGHNPGSALAALAMFALVPAVVVTGVVTGDSFEDVHVVLAYVLLGVIAAHLVGLVVHTMRHRDRIAVSMLTGRQPGAAEDGLRTAHPVWGGVLAASGLAWAVALFANHDAPAATVRLPLIGAVVRLEEHDDETARERKVNGGKRRENPHHDD